MSELLLLRRLDTRVHPKVNCQGSLGSNESRDQQTQIIQTTNKPGKFEVIMRAGL